MENEKPKSRVGGARPGAGRKPKDEERNIIESLKPYDDLAVQKLSEALHQGKDWALKLFFNYRFGMPKQTIDQKTELNFPKIDMNEWK